MRDLPLGFRLVVRGDGKDIPEGWVKVERTEPITGDWWIADLTTGIYRKALTDDLGASVWERAS